MDLDPRVVWAVEEIQRRLADTLTIDELASKVNLSRSRFAHVFREQTGMPPGRYLRQFRLDRARLLLETTFLSVKEVMAAVGLNDPSHFSRDFHEMFGATPREWRKRLQRPPPAPGLATFANGRHGPPTHRDGTGRARRLSSID